MIRFDTGFSRSILIGYEILQKLRVQFPVIKQRSPVQVLLVRHATTTAPMAGRVAFPISTMLPRTITVIERLVVYTENITVCQV